MALIRLLLLALPQMWLAADRQANRRMDMTEIHESGGTEIVTVFVRKGKTEDTRLVSFNIPQQMRDEVMADALNAHFAIDGHSIVYTVTPFTQVGNFFAQEGGPVLRFFHEDVEERPLTQVLNEVEVAIRDWLTEKGLLVYFA